MRVGDGRFRVNGGSKRRSGLSVAADRGCAGGWQAIKLSIFPAKSWLFEKHGTSKRRSWRKLNIGIDADSDQIVAFDLTEKEVDDASHAEPLLGQLDDAPASFMGDEAYDGRWKVE